MPKFSGLRSQHHASKASTRTKCRIELRTENLGIIVSRDAPSVLHSHRHASECLSDDAHNVVQKFVGCDTLERRQLAIPQESPHSEF
jgi:hypothetical protein